MAGNSGQGLLGPTAASRYLGVSRATLHRLVESGALVPTHRTSSGYRRFSTFELQRFQSMRGAATAVEPAEPEEVMTESLRRQSVLLDLAERISGPHTVESVCMAAATVARDTLKSGDRAAVWLVDGKQEYLIPKANVGYPSSFDESPFPIRGDSLTARVLRSGQPLVCEDALIHPIEGSDRARISSADLRAYVALPVLGPKQAHGLLLVGSRHPATFSRLDVSFLARMSKILAQALETALYLEHCEQVYGTVQALSDGAVDCWCDKELAGVAATALAELTHADYVLISVERVNSPTSAKWIAAWSCDGLSTEDLPPVPYDSALRDRLKGERRTVRIEDITAYDGLGRDSKRIGELLGASTWQVAPLSGPAGVRGAISLGFVTRRQLSQTVLRSISVIALHLSMALNASVCAAEGVASTS